MFLTIIIFTLESKIGFLNLGFGTYYDHCDVCGSRWAGWQNFFQTSNFDSLHETSLCPYVISGCIFFAAAVFAISFEILSGYCVVDYIQLQVTYLTFRKDIATYRGII